jgi:hypothetical protein
MKTVFLLLCSFVGKVIPSRNLRTYKADVKKDTFFSKNISWSITNENGEIFYVVPLN